MKSFTAEAQLDESGEVFIQMPEEFAKENDWRAGDTLSYKILEGELGIEVENLDQKARKAASAGKAPVEMELFVVEELVVHRVRHAIRANNAEDAMDLVAKGRSNEFDQNHVGSNILGARAVGVEEFLGLFEVPADPDLKKGFIQTLDYEKDELRARKSGAC